MRTAIFDQASDVTTASGKHYTNEELRAEPFYKALFEEPCVAEYNDEGRLLSFSKLEPIKQHYMVDEQDPEIALELCRKARDEEAAKFVSIEDVQAQLSALAGIA